MPRERGPFRVGERVLVPHTDKFYVAKALKAEKREDGWYYLLHYQGWNKKWDEWVEAPGLVKYDQKLVKPDEDKRGTDGGDGPGKKRRVDGGGAGNGAVAGDEVEPIPQFNVELPTELRDVLVADWDRILKQAVLRPLPRKPCVADILKGFVEATRSEKESVELEEELANGLQSYFDKALGLMLLYAQEREQYEKAKAPGVTASSMYGGEHLLRLLVKLPELLPMTNLPTDNFGTLELRVAAFVEYLQQHRPRLFAS